jgi:predicted phage-related endonuclease
MKVIPKPEHGSIDWLNQRQKDENGKTLLGGSDAPALMGDSPFKTPADLYVEKITPPVVGGFNMAFHRGNVLEAPLVAEASRILKVDLHTPDVMYRSGRWNINSDAVDNADAPSVNIECKTTTRYHISDGGDLPIEWCWQGWAQMAVLNVPVFFSVLDARQNLAVVELPRNDYAIDTLLQHGEHFCNAVDSGSGIDDFIDELSAEQINLLIKPKPEEVELDPEALEIITRLEWAKHVKKEAEEIEQEAKDSLARMLLSNEIGLVNGERVITWKQQAGKKSLDVSALRSAHPEIVAQFEREGNPFRVMRIVKKKEK